MLRNHTVTLDTIQLVRTVGALIQCINDYSHHHNAMPDDLRHSVSPYPGSIRDMKNALEVLNAHLPVPRTDLNFPELL